MSIGVQSDVERRYGPRRLRSDDDDDRHCGWFPVWQRVIFKAYVLVVKCIYSVVPWLVCTEWMYLAAICPAQHPVTPCFKSGSQKLICFY